MEDDKDVEQIREEVFYHLSLITFAFAYFCSLDGEFSGGRR